MWPGEQAPPPLPPPVGKGSISLREILLIGSREGCDPLELSRGAEGTDSPPHHPFSDSAEILWISGRGICSARKRFFLRGAGSPPKKSAPGATKRSDLLAPWASNPSAAQVAGLDWKLRGLRPSRALPEYSDEDFGSRRCGAWGALLPYTPSGTGCERVHTLSRSPGAVRSEGSVSGGTGGRRASACGTFASAAVCTKISFLTERVRNASRSSVLLLPQPFARKFRS